MREGIIPTLFKKYFARLTSIMYVSEFFDKKPHSIKLKNWKNNYISIQIDEHGKAKVSFWDNDRFEWRDYTFTLEDLANNNWVEAEI